jgi:hypothetical protein
LARTDLTKVQPASTGSNPTPTVGQTDGHMFPVNGHECIVVANSGASARTFTVVTPRSVEGQAVPDIAVSVPAGARRYIGDLEPGIYGQPSGADRGKCYVNYDVAAPAELNVVVLDVQPAS